MPPRSEQGALDPALQRALDVARPTRAFIDLDAIAANFGYLRERARGANVLCVVKADAYGHGAVPVARRLEEEGARWFGVALVEEGVEIRQAGVRGRILLLGGACEQQLPLALEADLTPVIVSTESWDALQRVAATTGKTYACHLKVDTGMTRLGIPWQEFDEFAKQIRPDGKVKVEGLLTHLASSDDPAVAFTRVQLERFKICRDILASCGLPRPILHVASSAGLLTRASSDVDLVRPGLALYGLNPFGNVAAPELTPALSLVSRVVRVAAVPAGTTVGYGCTHIMQQAARVATIPAGYEDGLSRGLGDNWEVSIRGKLCPLVGRISMDLVVADVTGVDGVVVGDDVGLVGGPESGGALPVEEMARRLRTIAYEVTCSISGRVPRIHLRDGRPVSLTSRFRSTGVTGATSATGASGSS